LPLLLGCRVGDDPLTRLATAWGDQTVGEASVPMASSLKLAAFVTDLCANQTEASWTTTEVGGTPPLQPAVAAVLGDPDVAKVAGSMDGTFQLALSGVAILDRSDVELRVVGTADDDAYIVTVEAWVLEDGQDALQIGTLLLAAQRRCTLHLGLWRGTGSWETMSGDVHAVTLGGGDDDDSAISISAEEPLVPVAGKSRWSGSVDGDSRSFSGYDAESFLVEDKLELGDDSAGIVIDRGYWPGLARGEDWSVEVNLPVDL
jgi:hypothetical protein